jgi:hypothetical protein
LAIELDDEQIGSGAGIRVFVKDERLAIRRESIRDLEFGARSQFLFGPAAIAGYE